MTTSVTPFVVSSSAWRVPQVASETTWNVTVTETPGGTSAPQSVTVPAEGASATTSNRLVWTGSAWA